MFDSQILAFTGIVAILTITPGVDTMLVIRNVLARGQQAGLLTALGICSGLFVHAALSGLGLSLILVRSAAAYETVKIAGACYLIFLGTRSIWQACRSDPQYMPGIHNRSDAALHTSRWKSIVEGIFTNVLNPKVAIFYLAFLPQFINPDDSVLGKSMLLASIHVVLGILWLTLVTVLLGRMRVWLAQPAVRRVLEAVTGAILIAFGARLAMEHR